MVEVALVGAAHIHTPGFINRLTARPDVKVKYVWDHDGKRAQNAATKLGATVVPAVRRIWDDPAIAAVVICAETNRHQELVTAAAEAGKHLFAEKPLGLRAADSLAMAAAVTKAKVLFQTGYFMRGDPIHRFVRQEIQQGHFGRVTRVRHSNCHCGSLKGWFDTEWAWMADPKIAGCGAYGDLGTHALDILLWLMGEVESCTASIQVVTGRYGDCDESGEGLLKFKNGAVGTLAAGWVDVANPTTLLVSGTEGHAVVVNGQLFYQSALVEGADGKQPWTKLPAPMAHPFDRFLDAVGGQTDVPLVPVAEAAYCVSVMTALYDGASKGAWVKPVTK